jgi:pimeloyl-ACP methyl ester carboxylesterase
MRAPGRPADTDTTSGPPVGHDAAGRAVQRLPHGRIEIALHRIRDGAGAGEGGPPLLLLHALGSSSRAWRRDPPRWPGPVYALDFAGHGASDPVHGGGYYPEYFLGDADHALAALGDRAVVAGRGIGAYVALLLAGARADRVPAALLLPGDGLAGAGSSPGFERWEVLSLDAWEERITIEAERFEAGTDPMASLADHEYRPDDYVADFANAARRLLLADLDRFVEPEWWTTVRASPHAETVPAHLPEAFERLAAAITGGNATLA